VVLADRSTTSRQGLEFLLATAGVEVVASVADLSALVEVVHRTSPDLAVVDAELPFDGSASGVSAALALKGERPGLGVIVIATHADTEEVLRLVDGADRGMGYLLTETVQDVLGLLDALRRVAAGGLALSPEVVGSLVAARSRSEPLNGLSGRDQEVLSLVAQGRSNTGIAEALLLSGRTTDSHVSDLLRGLGVQHDGTENGRARATLALLRPR
jgi:DNA-binding NarL/FixJ family response regulator